jgi:hypothetical protein
MELSSAGIILNNNYTGFKVNGDAANGTITITESGTYKFSLKDLNGNENRNSVYYKIKVMNDEAPTIAIIEPAQSNYILNGENELLLRARITDDYGFSKLVLGYRKLKVAGRKRSSCRIYYGECSCG